MYIIKEIENTTYSILDFYILTIEIDMPLCEQNLSPIEGHLIESNVQHILIKLKDELYFYPKYVFNVKRMIDQLKLTVHVKLEVLDGGYSTLSIYDEAMEHINWWVGQLIHITDVELATILLQSS